jgi:hypothetical protein
VVPDKDDKTDPDVPKLIPEERRKSSGDLQAVCVPPRPPPKPTGAYAVTLGTPIGKVTAEQEAAHPKFSELEPRSYDSDPPMLDPREDRTWVGEAPPIVAASIPPSTHVPRELVAALISLERYARDAKERAHKAENEARTAKLATQELGASNAADHLDIKTEIVELKGSLPKAARAGHWVSIGTSVLVFLGALVGLIAALHNAKPVTVPAPPAASAQK